MTQRLEKLYNLVYTTLLASCPYLSGNMANGIYYKEISDNKVQIVIEAKYYDVQQFKKTGAIIYTNQNKNGKTDYSADVNKAGGFFTHNKSEHWVNRACYNASYVIANEIGAELINELPL